MHLVSIRTLGQVASATFVALLFVFAATLPAAPPEAEATLTGTKQLPSFSLGDTEGNKHSLDEFARHKAIVLFFLGTECPVSNGYSPDMQSIVSKYATAGIACYGVHCDPTITIAEVAAHAKAYHLVFPMLLDRDQVLAHGSGVRVTPEAVVVSPTGKVLYRGRLDDRYSTEGKRRDEPTVRDLENALNSVLANEAPAVAETKAFGCPLPRRKSAAR